MDSLNIENFLEVVKSCKYVVVPMHFVCAAGLCAEGAKYCKYMIHALYTEFPVFLPKSGDTRCGSARADTLRTIHPDLEVVPES